MNDFVKAIGAGKKHEYIVTAFPVDTEKNAPKSIAYTILEYAIEVAKDFAGYFDVEYSDVIDGETGEVVYSTI